MSYPDDIDLYEQIGLEINKMIKSIAKIDQEADKEKGDLVPEMEDKISEVEKTKLIIDYLKGKI